MAKKGEKLTNYEKYLANIKRRGYSNLPIPDHEETIDELIAEGNRLLEQEAQKKATTPKAPTLPTKVSSNNPYLRARKKILSEMTEEKRRLIERLEKEGKTDSYQYEDFVAQICKLGDSMSN